MAKIVPLSEINRTMWDDFCLRSSEAWFWHTTSWLDFLEALLADHTEGIITSNKAMLRSFMVVNNCDTVLAIVPLIYTENSAGDVLSFEHLPTIAFCDDLAFDVKRDIVPTIFREIDRITKEIGASKISFIMHDLYTSALTYNPFYEFGYITYFSPTLTVDLRYDMETLWKQLRRSHRRHIVSLEKDGAALFTVYDKSSISKDIFREYKLMHHEDAGRITRSNLSFDIMYNIILDGNAVLMKLEIDNDVSYYYQITYKNNAYSASICERRLTHKSLRPKIEWEAIKYFKDNMVHYYELGTDSKMTFNLAASQKEQTISHFKEGFSNVLKNRVICEKYYDRDYMEKVMERRLVEYWSTEDNVTAVS